MAFNGQYQPMWDYPNEVNVEFCDYCGCQGHSIAACPIYFEPNQYSQVEVNTGQGWDQYSQAYDQTGSPDPNYDWSDPYQPDQFDPCYEPFTHEEPDLCGYGSTSDYVEETASVQHLLENFNTFMLLQSKMQTEQMQQLGALSAQMSQLSSHVSHFQREEEQIVFEEQSLDDQFLEPSPELTCQDSVATEITLIAPTTIVPEFETLEPLLTLVSPLEPVTIMSLIPPSFANPKVVAASVVVPLAIPFAMPLFEEPICHLDPCSYFLPFDDAICIDLLESRGSTDGSELQNLCGVRDDPSFPFNPG